MLPLMEKRFQLGMQMTVSIFQEEHLQDIQNPLWLFRGKTLRRESAKCLTKVLLLQMLNLPKLKDLKEIF